MVADEDKIDVEAACSLSEAFILPWESNGDGLQHLIVHLFKLSSYLLLSVHLSVLSLSFVKRGLENKEKSLRSGDAGEAFRRGTVHPGQRDVTTLHLP